MYVVYLEMLADLTQHEVRELAKSASSVTKIVDKQERGKGRAKGTVEISTALHTSTDLGLT